MFIIIIFSNICKRNTPNKCSSLYEIEVTMIELAALDTSAVGRLAPPTGAAGPRPRAYPDLNTHANILHHNIPFVLYLQYSK